MTQQQQQQQQQPQRGNTFQAALLSVRETDTHNIMDSAVIDLSAAYAVAIQSLNYDYIDRGNVVAPAWASTRAELWDTLD